MPRKGWSTAPDSWVQIIRGPRPPSESWPKVGRISAELHPKSNQVRSFERSVAASAAISCQCSARGRRRGSQETCRWYRGHIGRNGGSGHDRWPRGSGVEGWPLESEAICTRTTSRRPDQPDGVVPRKGKEEADRTRCSTPDTCKVVSNVSEQLQPQQMPFPDRALQQT